MTECNYPKCKRKATVTLDMDGLYTDEIPYCGEHAEEVMNNTLMIKLSEVSATEKEVEECLIRS